MAASPAFKIYRNGEYVASCKYGEDAAALCAVTGDNTVVKYHHKQVLWREGQEEFPAAESYDGAADIMLSRI